VRELREASKGTREGLGERRGRCVEIHHKKNLRKTS
jgi:hypothetical protein